MSVISWVVEGNPEAGGLAFVFDWLDGETGLVTTGAGFNLAINRFDCEAMGGKSVDVASVGWQVWDFLGDKGELA